MQKVSRIGFMRNWAALEQLLQKMGFHVPELKGVARHFRTAYIVLLRVRRQY